MTVVLEEHPLKKSLSFPVFKRWVNKQFNSSVLVLCNIRPIAVRAVDGTLIIMIKDDFNQRISYTIIENQRAIPQQFHF